MQLVGRLYTDCKQKVSSLYRMFICEREKVPELIARQVSPNRRIPNFNTLCVRLQQVVDDDRKVGLQAFGRADTASQNSGFLVKLPVLIGRHHSQVDIRHFGRQTIRQIGHLEHEWPTTPSHVVKERDPIGVTNKGNVPMVLVHDRIIKNLCLEASRSDGMPFWILSAIKPKGRDQFRPKKERANEGLDREMIDHL